MTAHPARGSETGTPKSLKALHPLMGGAAEGQPGEVLLFPSASLGWFVTSPVRLRGIPATVCRASR